MQAGALAVPHVGYFVFREKGGDGLLRREVARRVGRRGGLLQPGEDVAPGKMIVSARAEEIGEHRGEIDVKIEGEASKVAFNSKYLQDVLQVLDCSQVALETTTSSSPGVIRPVDVESYIHVVMPMFVQR